MDRVEMSCPQVITRRAAMELQAASSSTRVRHAPSNATDAAEEGLARQTSPSKQVLWAALYQQAAFPEPPNPDLF
jgi:hypothetical protein